MFLKEVFTNELQAWDAFHRIQVSSALIYLLANSFVKDRKNYGWCTEDKSQTYNSCEDNEHSQWNTDESYRFTDNSTLSDYQFFELDINTIYPNDQYNLESINRLFNIPHQFLCKTRASRQSEENQWTCTDQYESEIIPAGVDVRLAAIIQFRPVRYLKSSTVQDNRTKYVNM